MADSEHSFAKTRLPGGLNSSAELKGRKSVGQVKSFTHFLGKFLFFALFLIAIPLFPSQAPDFINQTVLTKFWELVHLLFIGLAVSYGLFCRRNDDGDIETHSNNTDDSYSYVSRVLHVSSLFDNGFDNSYGFNEKYAYQTGCSDSGSSVIGDQSKVRSLNPEVWFQYPSGCGENNVSQAWNYSQYVQSESMVVVNQENCAVNEYGESELMMDHKPLGLPVRSLRSGVRNQDFSEINNGTESSSVSTYSSISPKESIENTFGEVSPLNLENKFNEGGSAALSSPITRRSISGRMEMRENVGIASHPSHFRPHSVDETQFESLKSQSFWSTENFSSQISSMSDSPNRLSPSHAVSSELENQEVEDLGEEQSYRNSYPPASMPTNGKASLNAFHIRRYTSGSLFEKNVQKSFEDNLKNRDESQRKDQLDNQEWRSGSLKWNGSSDKTSSRGKSVRTFRSRRYEPEAAKRGEKSGNCISNDVGKPKEEIEAVCKGKSEMANGGLDNLSASAKKQDVDYHFPMPKPTHSQFQKWKNKEHSQRVAVESKEISESKAENYEVKSDEGSMTNSGNDAEPDLMTNSGNDAEPDPNEVDKKAGEFIARFREQIRLQKMASISKSRGHKHHHFR
ncbi:hypothetical protein AB3S75_021172 [Citrus x aurantiifolia]